MKEQAGTDANSDYRFLQTCVGAIIQRHRSEFRINPAWIATEALNEIDPRKFDIKSMPHFYRAAHLALTQIARELLGTPSEGDDYQTSPDEILAEGEYNLHHKRRVAALPKRHLNDDVIVLDLRRNRSLPNEPHEPACHADGHSAAGCGA